MDTESRLYVERHGEGGPTLVLLHGLGATGTVWRGLGEVLADRWPGRWLVVDLPGHGRSAPLGSYSFGGMAAAIAREVDGDPVVVLGHSLGGVLGLTLASGWFGVPVAAACGLGIKIDWTGDELAKAAGLAAKPNRVFPTRAEALDRSLKVGGLAGLVAPESDDLSPSVVEADGGWRLALDPGAFGVGAPDMTGLLAAARADVVLAAGERDPMCPPDRLRAVRPDAVVLDGLGHNAHVEDPAALWPLLERLLDAVRA
ncbi:pimeloyl-ACP methyl ester carboxylesterase [Herbihabitans rhizosphaerae]|uniref:Pimeloyl-ACP methyl ester carboxylesterase n=1 Tax=Herbihabitans rhizosphaerae TaxID=1872711 RepID=A0A4Q7L1B5_9PSEU|nr:alpha/beta hydrolase [Herbihabitans rhizosphaerae]RZS43299.1 pimeloyl-ACP methyl ester carboxylesterase [Herbihabitans rhizosphaerae]